MPPSVPAQRARSSAGKSFVRGASNSSFASFVKSSGGRRFGTRSGHVTANWIGKHMSVALSCASTELSTNSTIEWMMLCGCTITSTRAISTSKSQRASIISRPLLKRVAESIVIFAPMTHVGCFSACARVTFSKSAAGHVRNGPPLAVKMMRRTCSGLRPSMHWKIALCSLSTGSTCTPFLRAAVITASPAITRISLLATAMSLPASIAASAGRRPAVPTMEMSTMSASGIVASSHRPSSPTRSGISDF